MPLNLDQIKAIASRAAESVIQDIPPVGTPHYIFRVEEEPLLPQGKKYTAFYPDGTPRYLAAASAKELIARIRQGEPQATFEVEASAEAGAYVETKVIKIEPQAIDARGVRDYWDKYLEHNALRVNNETDAGAFLSNQVEAAGDILREYSKGEYKDWGYIYEKIRRLQRNYQSRDWTDRLSSNEIMFLGKMKTDVSNLPIVDSLTSQVKEILTKILDRDAQSVKSLTDALDSMIQKSMGKEANIQPEAESNQEAAPCPNLQPMAEWIKGNEPGTCRPCILTPVVQWYWEELKEQGYEEMAAQLEAEVEGLEENNVQQIMALCEDLDEIKASVPEELRKRLEEFDCSIQIESFDPGEIAETSAEVQTGG